MILLAPVAAASDLVLRMEAGPPASLPLGCPTAVHLRGACYHRGRRLTGLALLVDGVRHAPTAWRMPRADLAAADDPADPRCHRYRSGFWATVPIPGRNRAGTVELAVAARIEGGGEAVAPLATIAVGARRGAPADRSATPHPDATPSARAATMPAACAAGRGASLAICMATHEPDPALLRRQLDSLRAQTDDDWVCVVSDDGSSPERYAEIEAALGGDPRFALSRAPARLGPYRNFERALGLIPASARLVALCDQDDVWHADKLATLRAALGSAQLVYSDQRLVDRSGRVLADTLWEGRRNDHRDIVSLLVANSVTGAASLFRREVAERALPFPDPGGWPFHDHWIALVALACGDIAYVDRPLYDYVQHRGAVTGRGERRRRSPLAVLRGWRAAYFVVYLPRTVMARAALLRCAPWLARGKRRALRRFVAAERSPSALAWLALRPLWAWRATLGSEAELVRGILWRRLVDLRVRGREAPGRSAVTAACPPLTADTIGQRRLGRWRAGRG